MQLGNVTIILASDQRWRFPLLSNEITVLAQRNSVAEKIFTTEIKK